MNKALAEVPMPQALRANLRESLQQLATHMINQPPA
jgi:truncated hemoglobin YjbI